MQLFKYPMIYCLVCLCKANVILPLWSLDFYTSRFYQMLRAQYYKRRKWLRRRVSTLGETVIQRTSCQTSHGKLQGRSYPHFNPGGRTYFLEYCWRTLHSFPVATNNFQLLPCRVLRNLLVPNPMYRQMPSGSCSIVEMKTQQKKAHRGDGHLRMTAFV